MKAKYTWGYEPRSTPTAVKLTYLYSASYLFASQMLADTMAMAVYDHILLHLQLANNEVKLVKLSGDKSRLPHPSRRATYVAYCNSSRRVRLKIVDRSIISIADDSRIDRVNE